MTNPWLYIPALDYEGHMKHPSVSQLSFLSNIFKESLLKHNGSSVAYLGCATGNGLDYINNDKTKKLTVIDINPEYLEILRSRYQSSIPNLQIIEADLQNYECNNNEFSLIFAGLIFEYLDPLILLKKIANWLKDIGVMVVVLQLNEHNIKKVTDTPYSSLKLLDSVIKLVSEDNFKLMANESGLREIEGKKITLKSGKPFYVGTYEKIA